MKNLKNLLFVLSVLFVAQNGLFAQKFGVKVGLSSDQLKPKELAQSSQDSFSFKVKNADYGLHFGLFGQFQFSKFCVQPEIVFNSVKINYTLRDSTNRNTSDSLRSEKFTNLDIPVIFGAKYFNKLRIGVGPVGHVQINSASDLKNYKELAAKLTYSYQVGLGLDIWKLAIDVRYEDNISKKDNSFTYKGKEYKYANNTPRIVASVGYRF